MTRAAVVEPVGVNPAQYSSVAALLALRSVQATSTASRCQTAGQGRKRNLAAQLRKLLSKPIRFQNRGVREHPVGQRTTRGRIIEVTRRYVGVHV